MPADSRVQLGSNPNRRGKRLDSWKQIAGYLDRHVTTVRRWEHQENLPVHRQVHSKLDSVYAYSTELDAWIESRHPGESGTTATSASSEAPARFGSVPPPPSLRGLRPWTVDLLGREREIELLENAWSAASWGQQQLVLISGDPGLGKTRLAFEFARFVARRETALPAGCDREALVPFAPFVTMLQWVVRASPEKTLRRWLKDVEGSSELTQLVPGIAKYTRGAPELVPAAAEGRRFRMFEAFTQLVIMVSRDCPMLLLFEDLHWADTGSLIFLRHLIRSTRDSAICIVITYLENEPALSEFSAEVFQEIRREFPALQIRLGGLAEDHVRQFIESYTHQAAPQ
jgi:AAA ATPase domain